MNDHGAGYTWNEAGDPACPACGVWMIRQEPGKRDEHHRWSCPKCMTVVVLVPEDVPQ